MVNSHRAIDDVKATVEVLKAMDAERSDLCRYVNLFGYNPKYGVEGRRIRSVRYVPQPYNSGRLLYDTAQAILQDDQRRETMSRAMASLGVIDATEKIYDAVMSLRRGSGK